MKHSDAFPSKYLAKDGVEPPVTVTIKDVYKDKVKDKSGDVTKTVMAFRDPDVKPMIVNNTNWTIIEGAYGEDSDDWIGKKIEIYHDPSIMYGGKMTGGLRVRIHAKAPASAAPKVYTMDQARALLEGAGVSLDVFKAALPKNTDGKALYAPERDSHVVDELLADIAAGKQAADELAF